MKTLAAILVETRQPLVVDEVELPALGIGQALVEIKATRICGSQLGEIDAVKGPDKWLPHLLGHEGGGHVLEIGPGVKHVKPGDHVVLHWRPGAGLEGQPPPKYKWGTRTVNAGNITTFQRYAVISENRLTPVPADLSDDVCCLLADTLTTGFGVITRDAKIEIGESVVVIGAGGIGLGVILGAKLAGAYPIIACDLYHHKLEVAKRYGATHVINTREQPLTATVKEILNGAAPDAVIDGTGRPQVIEEAFALAAPKGRCVIFGVMPHDLCLSLNTLPLHFGKVLTGSEGGQSRPAQDIPRLVRMIRGHAFDPSGMISHRCKLSEVNSAIVKMRAGETIHTVIDF
jgi:S-(hydroxymethyl)glutathione dehydrogenase/alcohol dehydrogenase